MNTALRLISVLMVMLLGTNPALAVEDIDVQQAQAMSQQGLLLLDVREPGEYDEVHAPNAKLIPLGQLNARLNEIARYKDQPVAVMCRSGRRSAQAAELLEQAGFSRVNNVSGGIVAWENAGLTVVRKK